MTRVYSDLKFLHYPERLDALRSGRTVAPVHVRIKPINRCNHNCSYCAYRIDNLRLGETMDEQDRLPADKLLEICSDLVEMGVEAVTFSGGGEPMLHKQLPDAIELLGKGGVRVAALSNGSNLKGRMADAFARHGSWVRVSLDAWDDSSYSEARGVADGAFTNLKRNMRAFSERSSPCTLGVSLIVTPANVNHIFDVCLQMKELGVQHVKVTGVVMSNEGDSANDFHKDIREHAEREIARAKELSDAEFTVVNHYHALEERFERPYRSCPFARLLTVIGADLTVYTCQDKAYTQSGRLGSIADRRFRDFWLSDEAHAGLAAVDPSQSCRHHCVAHKKNLVLSEYLSIDSDHAAFV